MTLTFVTADLTQHRDILMRFNIDYGNWVGEGVLERFEVPQELRHDWRFMRCELG